MQMLLSFHLHMQEQVRRFLESVPSCVMLMQGRSIPIEDMRDVEVELMDQSGKLITLRERVAVSSQIPQAILSYGKLLEELIHVNRHSHSVQEFRFLSNCKTDLWLSRVGFEPVRNPLYG